MTMQWAEKDTLGWGWAVLSEARLGCRRLGAGAGCWHLHDVVEGQHRGVDADTRDAQQPEPARVGQEDPRRTGASGAGGKGAGGVLY